MKIYWNIIITCLLPLSFFSSCSNPEMEKELATLKEKNQQLSQKAENKDSTINEFIRSFNEVEENLATIKEKENIISKSSKDMELQKSQQEQIVSDIQLINELLIKNKQKIAWLNKQLRNSNLKISEIEKMISRLEERIKQKNMEIDSLKNELTKVNSAFSNLFTEYNTRLDEMARQENKLNTAYYVFGTLKELKGHGVITKEGSFIGIGGAEKLKKDFNKSYFTQVDISLTMEIPVLSKKAKIITTHPSGSYKFEGSVKKVEKLIITNPEEFWSVSKYLVIVVE